MENFEGISSPIRSPGYSPTKRSPSKLPPLDLTRIPAIEEEKIPTAFVAPALNEYLSASSGSDGENNLE